MDIIKICLASVIFGVLILYLREVNKEMAALSLVAAVGVILMLVVDALGSVFSLYERLGEIGGIAPGFIKLIIKITIICYIIEFSVGLIEDFGLKSLADKLSLVGKVVILIMATPIIENLINVIISIVS